MLFNIPWLEWIGYLSSIIIAVSLTMSSIQKLRWYNLFGAVLFTFYGFAIGAMPVGLVNFFIIVVDVYYLIRMYSEKESFQSLTVKADDAYLNYFLNFHETDIQSFFPDFKKKDIDKRVENNFVFLLIRNSMPVGVFFGEKNKDSLQVYLDYVTLPYRDLKPGDFIYKQNTKLFVENGVKTIVSKTNNEKHRNYLNKMGFILQSGTQDIYQLNL